MIYPEPAFSCRVLSVVAITSPILMKPLLEPMVREFVVRELINAVVPCKLKVEREDTLRTAKVLPSCVER